MTNRILSASFAFVSVMFLYACGIGTEGGIGGTGISTGSVTSFGSVYVNGVRFDTTNTSIVVNGNTFPNGDERTLLSEGMVVTVTGNINADGSTGTANQITYNQSLEGPIQGTPTANSFVLLGQTVLVDSQTQVRSGLIYPTSFADGDVVEVSGFTDPNGNLRATFIEKTDNTEFSILGVITSIDSTANTFVLNNAPNQLTVVWSNTSTLSVNDFVKVEGNALDGSGALIATSVEQKTSGFGVTDADDAELEGYALSACGTVPCTFNLNNQTVSVSSGTVFEGGLVSDIQSGTKLEVEGRLSNSVLLAEKIEFKESVELQSTVTSKTVNTLTLEYGSTDITVSIDDVLTEINGIANVNSIAPNDSLKIRGRQEAANTVFATRVDWQDVSTDIELQGNVTAIGTDSITVLGVTVDTSSFQDSDFKDINDVVIGRSTFYANLSVNDLVSFKGTIVAGNITWSEVEMEN